MTTLFSNEKREADFQRYKEQWESAVLSAAMAELADLDAHERAELVRSWLMNSYNGASFAVYDPADVTDGKITWAQAGPTQYDCLYEGPYGMKCALGRVYQQPNGTWGALVIAGVRDDLPEAIAAAEWAISRLCA